MAYTQDPPFCIKVEPTEGCNLRCPFCGINGIRGKERTYEYMNVKTALQIAKQIAKAKWNCRIEFAARGEPTKNPQLPEIVSAFRSQLPNASLLLLTNGSGFLAPNPKKVRETVMELFERGINTIGVDEYQNVPWASAIRTALKEAPLPEKIPVYEYPRDKKGNPHPRYAGKQRLTFIAPIDLQTHGTHSSINTHCGSGAPPDYRLAKAPCAYPFREMHVRYDGKIAICCNDWRGVMAMGDTTVTAIDKIWHGELFGAVRRKLLHGERTFSPCYGCNARSYRVGLLPDPSGAFRKGYPVATPRDHKLIAQALNKPPLTTPVERPWENLIKITPNAKIGFGF